MKRQTKNSTPQIRTSSPYKATLALAKEKATKKINQSCNQANQNTKTAHHREQGKRQREYDNLQTKNKQNDSSDAWYCFMFEGSVKEDIIECQACLRWAHIECTGVGNRVECVCELCDN